VKDLEGGKRVKGTNNFFLGKGGGGGGGGAAANEKQRSFFHEFFHALPRKEEIQGCSFVKMT